MFFLERDFQRAAHYFRKSEEYWAVCSLLRKIVQLPAYVHYKCLENFSRACAKVYDFSILSSHFDFISHAQPLAYDSSLKQRIIHNFVPFFHMIRKADDELLKLFSECWLFSALLLLPNQHSDLFCIVRDTTNKLPLRYCETILKAENHHDLLFELFYSRKIYKPALDIMINKCNAEKSSYWAIKIKDFLVRMSSNVDLFLDYLQQLFCVSKEHAEELVLSYPPILDKIDILNVLVPIMMKFSDCGLVIQFLVKRQAQNEANYLARLYIEETIEGNVNPKELVRFLSSRPIKYDPKVVLGYFPKHLLQREKCLVLDQIEKYEEIIHYYIYQEKNLETAKQYVLYKKNQEVSSLFIMKICKPPMTESAMNVLTDFLNSSSPEAIDHNVAFTFLPSNLEFSRIQHYLFNAFHHISTSLQTFKVKRSLQDNFFLDLIGDYYKFAQDSIEIHEDTRCDKCNKKIKTQDFCFNKQKEIVHTHCVET
jgi:hypothetical protein